MTAQAAPLPSPILNLGVDAQDRPQTPNQLALRRFRRNKLAVASVFVVLFFAVVALVADFAAPFGMHDTSSCVGFMSGTSCTNAGDTFQYAPFLTHDLGTGKLNLLGTDSLGRDTLTRLMFGARISMMVGFISQAVVLAIGVPIGLLAGFFGGWVDNLLMRITDITYGFPDLLFVILIATVLGRSVWVIFIALGLTAWVTMARLVRGQVLQVKNMDYVLSARSIGTRNGMLMWRHIVPNILSPVIVLVTLGIPGAIIAEATLTFLGVGIDPSTPTWGTMVDEAQTVLSAYPLAVIVPTVAIAILSLAFTFIGDGVSDMFDPRRK